MNSFTDQNDDGDLERISPLHRVSDFQSPVLQIALELPVVVRDQYAKQLHQGLLDRSIASRLVLLPEDVRHVLEKQESRQTTFTEIERFLAEHLAAAQ